jgi:hypothetical protein
MTIDDTTRWLISGIAFLSVCIFAAMWRELSGIRTEIKESNAQIKELAIKQSNGDTRLLLLEKIIDRLPCLGSDLKCRP